MQQRSTQYGQSPERLFNFNESKSNTSTSKYNFELNSNDFQSFPQSKQSEVNTPLGQSMVKRLRDSSRDEKEEMEKSVQKITTVT